MILAFTGLGIGEFASEVTGDFLSHAKAQRRKESFKSLVIVKILLLRESENLNLLVFNSDAERITQWIP
ncbi:hypothetical protein PN450_07635 [Dolichospermum lemmermannii CS-548]|uniref:hypothetical protein n=1 Tax=Dolichospermum TaxID=748770 RepID=UPI001AEFE6E1|nr:MULTISPECIES: hypothetical protein [Dolichospermum]MDB9436677.1 hypothetical protein [Dolichospermum lemmermannii CS-548]